MGEGGAIDGEFGRERASWDAGGIVRSVERHHERSRAERSRAERRRVAVHRQLGTLRAVGRRSESGRRALRGLATKGIMSSGRGVGVKI